MSERMGRRYIHQINMECKVPILKPFLSKKENVSVRTFWGAMWIVLSTAYRWIFIFSVSEEESFPHDTSSRQEITATKHCPKFKSGFLTVSVWGGFSLLGKTSLIGLVGKFVQNTYRNIIDNHVLPYMYNFHGCPTWFVLQEDTCGPHRAKSYAKHLSNEGVIRMKWPTQSLDMNPIENIREVMKEHLRKRTTPPRIQFHLFQILPKMWNSLPDSNFTSLVASIPKCTEHLRNNCGRSTK